MVVQLLRNGRGVFRSGRTDGVGVEENCIGEKTENSTD